MERNKLIEMYEKYNLEKTDVFKHQHFLILKRSAVEKIMALETEAVNKNWATITK